MRLAVADANTLRRSLGMWVEMETAHKATSVASHGPRIFLGPCHITN